MEMSRGGSADQPPENQDSRTARAPIKGRGAASRADGRFEKRSVRGEDDGWGSVYEDLADPPHPQTHVTEERARSIISRNQSPDVPFDRSINPYRGCEHNIYALLRSEEHTHRREGTRVLRFTCCRLWDLFQNKKTL